MVRVGISVEGTTEERFIEVVLVPYLEAKGTFVTPISLGGNVSLDRVKDELKRIANSFDYVSTFYDFYGFKGKDAGETKESLEAKMLDRIHDRVKPKLIPYIQMYEFEGLLFSEPQAMEVEINEEGIAKWASAILNGFNDNPEAINDSYQTAPSKRLEANTGYLKTTHGPNIAKAIGVDSLRQKCPGFDAWLAKLELLSYS